MLARFALAAALLLGALQPQPLSVKITSPLGRTGTSGTLRIVAQVVAPPPTVVKEVRFFVDGKLLGTDTDGAPYAVEWVDENPFEERTLAVEVEDSQSKVARDSITLPAYEVSFASGVASVLLDVSVHDSSGRFVVNLTKDQFHLEENYAPQPIDLLDQQTVPGTFLLLVDASQSMARRIDFVRHAAEKFISFLRPKDQVIVAPFTATLGALTGPTTDHATIGEAISAIKAKGGTAILDCLQKAAEHLDGLEGRHTVVLITDGYDENSSSTPDEAVKALQSAHVTAYVVAIGGSAGISLKGEDLLRRIAIQTGGKAFFPPRERDLVQAYDMLATDAQHRYLISYTPTDQSADGTWREISLSTTLPKLIVTTRPGYFAPKPAPVRPSLEFTVTDAAHRYVEVTADDLTVIEDGVEQKIDSFQEAISPVSIVLAIDASGSMRRVATDVVQAAQSFVGSIRKEDSLALITFADKAELTQDLTTVREGILDAIGDYKALGGTALYDALDEALLRLARVQGRRVVVALTDGRDEDNPGTGPGSTRPYSDVLEHLKQTGATMYVIGLGTKVDHERLDQLAKLSGGAAYYPTNVSTLGAEYRRIVEALRQRWVISYTSTNGKHDGKYRKVDIKPRSESLHVASGGGYFAPER